MRNTGGVMDGSIEGLQLCAVSQRQGIDKRVLYISGVFNAISTAQDELSLQEDEMQYCRRDEVE